MRAKTTGQLAIFALAAIGAIVLVCFPSVSSEAIYPVGHAKRAFFSMVGARVRGFFNGSSASVENQRLRREVAALKVLKGDVARLEVENARLRRALDYSARTPEIWLPAGVLSAGGGAAGVHEFVRVDKGSSSGVKEGAIVVVPEGVVGRVTEVHPHSAEVTLLSDPSVKVACELALPGARKVQGVLTGGGNEHLVLRHLTGTEGLRPSVRVFTSGRGGIFPRGLSVGTLLGVRKDAKGLAYEGEVLPSVDFSTLEDVFIRHEK